METNPYAAPQTASEPPQIEPRPKAQKVRAQQDINSWTRFLSVMLIVAGACGPFVVDSLWHSFGSRVYWDQVLLVAAVIVTSTVVVAVGIVIWRRSAPQNDEV
jgi:hypothetical protein